MEDEEDAALDYYRSGNLDDDKSRRMGDNSGEDEDTSLDGLEVMDLLREGRKILIRDLIVMVKTGMATPAEKAVLAKLLKDNGVILGDPEQGAGEDGNPKAAKKPRDLPQFTKPEYDR